MGRLISRRASSASRTRMTTSPASRPWRRPLRQRAPCG
jgi:hypothetical protein